MGDKSTGKAAKPRNRRALSIVAQRLAEASHASRAAGLAADQIETAQREIHAKQLALELKIVAEVQGQLEAAYTDTLDELRVAIEGMNQSLAKAYGFREMIGEQGRNLMASGNKETGRAILARLERLAAPDPRSFGATAGEIAAAAASWRLQADILRGRV